MKSTLLDRSPTTIGSYSLAIRKALEASGYDTGDIFARAGIAHPPGNDPMERHTTAQVAALFRYCVEVTGNPAFGLTVARFMHPSSLHALGYSLLASSTLRDCCQRLVNYFRLASEQGGLIIIEQGDRFCLSSRFIADGVAFETIDCWHAFLIRLFRLIYQPDFAPLAVKLSRPRPIGFEEQYTRSFHAPVEFDAAYCEISLDRAWVDQPLLGGNREIARQNDRIIDQYLAALDRSDIVTRVKNLIIQGLSSGNCSKQSVAKELCISASGLQQKLAQRDTGFQSLLNQVREALALAYIEQARVSITEMSFMLGFSNTSSFTRAFHRWTGTSPRDYRRELGIDNL